MKKVTSLRDLENHRYRSGRIKKILLIILILAVAGLLGYLTYAGTRGNRTEPELPAESGTEDTSFEDSAPLEDSMPSEDSAPSEDSKPEDSLPDGNTDTEDSSSDPNTSSDDTETDVSAFDDTVFIGDSRTLGLQMATGLTNATFLAERNMAVNRGEEKFFRLSDGSKGTLYQALAEKQYQKVYVMFGVNELGWPEASTFADSYAIMLDRIRESQPNATIYVQSILPITKERSDSDTIYNNTNVNLFNEAIRQMVATRDVVYLDVASVFRDTDGALFADASTDGIHLTFEYCGRWLQYLADHQ